MAALQQLRRKAAIVEGPGVGQVLPETQLPPKQSPSCLLITGPGGILRALPGKGPGTGHKGSICPGKLRRARCRQLPGRSPYVSPMATATVVLGPRCLLPPLLCHAERSRTPAQTLWEAAGWMQPLLLQGSSAGARQGPVFASKVLHKHQPGWPPCGDKVCPWAEPPTEVSSSCRAVPEEPSSIPAPASPPGMAEGTSRVGDTGFPARGIPHRAKPRLWLAAGRGPGADALRQR